MDKLVSSVSFDPAPARRPANTVPRLDVHMPSLLALLATLLMAVASLAGLAWPSMYARETPAWASQALAQDWFDLLIAVPATAGIAAWSFGGSRRARLVLAGALVNMTYTFAIYAFAVHLNAMFLIYCAVLSLSAFALFGLGAELAAEARPPWGPPWSDARLPRRSAAFMLIGVGVVFAGLWLVQIVPALRTGAPPREFAEVGLATNPVHVLDLAFVLPLHVLAGVMLLTRRPAGPLLAATLLAFGVLMAASIATMVVLGGGPTVVAAGMGAISALSLLMLTWVLRHVREAA